MKLCKCDKCGKEAKMKFFNLSSLCRGWNKPNMWVEENDKDLCPECNENYKRMTKDFFEIKEAKK